MLLADRLKGKIPLYGMNKVKFKAVVKPNDTIRFECRLVKEKLCSTLPVKGFVGESCA